jgi:hypothetical protein
MSNTTTQFLFAITLTIALNSCGINSSLSSTAKLPTATRTMSIPMPVSPTLTLEPTLVPTLEPSIEPTLPPIMVTIQEGNPYPKFSLHPKQSGKLEDNRMGVLVGGLTGGGWKPGDPWDYAWMADQVIEKGLKRFRVSIDNLDAGSADLDWGIPQFTIDPSHDTLITLLAQKGVTITYVLTFWDKDTWPEGKGANCPRFRDEAEIERYLHFVQFIVNHFKDRIQNFEIWNEPNIEQCPQWIKVADYINLTRRATSVIRQEYPEAKIVVGATSYLGEAGSQEYLFSILDSDIMPLVDIVSWHPMYGTSPEFDPKYYSKYPSILQKIKDKASAHGFNGTYEADELTWFTIDGIMTDGWSKRYSDTIAAKYMARGIVMHLGMDVTAGIGSALVFDSNWVSIPSTVRNLSTIMAGVKTTNFPIEIDSKAKNIVSYTFSLSTGASLVAFWVNDAASEDSSDVRATLTLPSLTSQHVTSMDVLNGFEQQLVTSNENGNLVIRNLLIKDYPIIIRLTNPKYP